jgi:hypothetical protein
VVLVSALSVLQFGTPIAVVLVRHKWTKRRDAASTDIGLVLFNKEPMFQIRDNPRGGVLFNKSSFLQSGLLRLDWNQRLEKMGDFTPRCAGIWAKGAV